MGVVLRAIGHTEVFHLSSSLSLSARLELPPTSNLHIINSLNSQSIGRITIAAQLQQYLESLYGVRRLMHRRRRPSETVTQQVGPGRGGGLGGQLKDPTPPHCHKHSSSSCNSGSFSDTYTLPLLAGAGSLVGINAST